jgi:chromosome segregation ATPase
VFRSGIKDIDQDIDQEYIGIQHHFAVKLKEEQDIFLKIKDENHKMRAEYDALSRLIENNKEEVVKMNLEEKKLRNIIKILEVEIDGLKNEIQEREETILDKDNKIHDLRKKNQELEKFKFVLDYKIVELRKQIEPKEKDIVTLTTQIEEISTEIKDYGAKEVILRNSLDEFRMKDRAVAAENAGFIRKKETFQNLLKEIMRDVATVWKSKDELNAVKRLIVSLFHKYSELNLDKSAIISSCGSHKINLGKNHKDPMEKHTLSRVALERTIKVIESQKLKARKSRFKEALRFTSENALLKGEMNYLTTTLQKTNRQIIQLKSVLNGDDSSPKNLHSQHQLEFANIEDPFPQAPVENLTTDVENPKTESTSIGEMDAIIN